MISDKMEIYAVLVFEYIGGECTSNDLNEK